MTTKQQFQSATGTAEDRVNGISVADLTACIDAVSADPAAGQTDWKIRSVWQGGTRTDHFVDGFRIGGASVDRAFVIRVDEPHELCGTNEYANPQEHLLSAMNACMMVGYSAVAALMGIRLESLELETTGRIDLRGFLGITDEVAAGYEGLRQVVRISGDATPEQFERLHNVVRLTSPNFFNITRAIPVDSQLEATSTN